MSGFTEFFACMRLSGDKWGDMRILPLGEAVQTPQSSGAFFGLGVSQTVCIVADAQKSAVLFCAKQAITRLNIEAGERLLPMVDEGMVLEALLRLVDNERHLLYDGGRFFARIKLSCDDLVFRPYPVENAVVTITLWHEKSDVKLCDRRIFADEDSSRFGRALICELARQKGYDSALLMDGVYQRYILGLADADIFFRIDDRVVSPAFGGAPRSIMHGCAVELMRDWGIEVDEKRLSADELVQMHLAGRLSESFSVDTYNIVSRIVCIDGLDSELMLPGGKLSKKLFDAMVNIGAGIYPAPNGWIQRV